VRGPGWVVIEESDSSGRHTALIWVEVVDGRLIVTTVGDDSIWRRMLDGCGEFLAQVVGPGGPTAIPAHAVAG
jgi:hypothetical protein